MKKRIFISTNNDKDRPLRGLFSVSDFTTFRQLPIYRTLIFPEGCDVLYYDSTSNSFKSDAVDTNIFLVRDSLLALPVNIQIDNNDLLLHHDNETAHLDYIKPLFEKKTEGHHIANENEKYLPVFKIIFGDTTNKVDEILKVLGFSEKNYKLEALIRLNKILTLLPLKGNWTSNTFTVVKQALENSENITPVKDKLANINYNENIAEFLKQLEPIETEIINLSAAK